MDLAEKYLKNDINKAIKIYEYTCNENFHTISKPINREDGCSMLGSMYQDGNGV